MAPDGTQWWSLSTQSLPVEYPIGSVSVSNGQFLMLIPASCGSQGTGTCLLTSTDGLVWSVSGLVTFSTEANVTTAVHLGATWLAIGSMVDGAGIWTSPDGVSWDWLGDQDAFQHACTAGQHQNSTVYEVYATETVIVAEGQDQCNSTVVARATWHSADGSVWQRVDAPQMFEVAKSNGAYVGQDENGAVRYSSDGLNWSAPVDLGTNISFDTAAVSTGFVGVSATSPGMDPHRVITSPDGRVWTDQPNNLGTAGTGGLTSDGSRAVLLETDAQSPDAIWLSTSAGTGWARYELPETDRQVASSIAINGNRIVVAGGYAGTTVSGSLLWVTDLPPAHFAVRSGAPLSRLRSASLANNTSFRTSRPAVMQSAESSRKRVVLALFHPAKPAVGRAPPGPCRKTGRMRQADPMPMHMRRAAPAKASCMANRAVRYRCFAQGS